MSSFSHSYKGLLCLCDALNSWQSSVYFVESEWRNGQYNISGPAKIASPCPNWDLELSRKEALRILILGSQELSNEHLFHICNPYVYLSL